MMIKSKFKSFQFLPLLLVLVVVVILPRSTLSANNIANDTTTTAIVNCTLCPEGSFPGDPSARADFGDSILTCQQVYDKEGSLFLTEGNCSFLQSIGTTICACQNISSSNSTNTDGVINNSNCTLCPDAKRLPQPLQESFPGISCAQLQVNAQRDTEHTCSQYQTVVGHYCGCNETNYENDTTTTTTNNTICRLCGTGVDLPNPQLLLSVVERDGSTKNNNYSDTTPPTTTSSSCIELEFEANLDPATDCNFFSAMYSPICCTGTPAPTPVSATSAGYPKHCTLLSQHGCISTMVAVGLVMTILF